MCLWLGSLGQLGWGDGVPEPSVVVVVDMVVVLSGVGIGLGRLLLGLGRLLVSFAGLSGVG